jgi:hypothetical protein
LQGLFEGQGNNRNGNRGWNISLYISTTSVVNGTIAIEGNGVIKMQVRGSWVMKGAQPVRSCIGVYHHEKGYFHFFVYILNYYPGSGWLTYSSL